MWALYRLDVFGRYDERLAEILLERLSYEPMSLYRAEQLGGPEWYGYGLAAEAILGVADEVHLNTKAAAQRKARLRESEMRPRPHPEERDRIVHGNNRAEMLALFASLNGKGDGWQGRSVVAFG